MQTQQHLCGPMIDVGFFDTHGEIILDMQDHDTGEQIDDRCPECGEEVNAGTLFPLDMFPEVYAQMGESLVEV